MLYPHDMLSHLSAAVLSRDAYHQPDQIICRPGLCLGAQSPSRDKLNDESAHP